MARRKKGRDLSGWLLVDKPGGVTSSDVVNKLRWRYQARKAGHGGTLDPDATGLLPIAFGEATKLLPFLENRLKTYAFSVRWGAETSTDDAAGEILKTSDARPEREEILASLAQFIGQIEQIPPAVSAVKVNGERAYELVREGIDVELKSRPLWVEELSLLDAHRDEANFRLRCGKGGYVRSIARDLGRALDVLGHVGALRRIATLGFDIEEAHEYEKLVEEADDGCLLPITDTPDFPHLEVTDGDAERLRNGNPVKGGYAGEADFMLALHKNEPIAIVSLEYGIVSVKRGLQMKSQ